VPVLGVVEIGQPRTPVSKREITTWFAREADECILILEVEAEVIVAIIAGKGNLEGSSGRISGRCLHGYGLSLPTRSCASWLEEPRMPPGVAAC